MRFILGLNLLIPIALMLNFHWAIGQKAFTEGYVKANEIVAKLLENYVEQEEVVGLALTVIHKGQIIYSNGFGKANLELGVLTTDSTLFRLASVSKLFTAAAIAKLSEEGLIDLDAPVQDYVPEFTNKRWQPTIRQISAHIGGIRGYQAKDFKAGYDIFKNEFPTTDDALSIFISDSLLFEPGAAYKYSTFGFTLLTAAIENVTSKRFEDYLSDELLAPLKIGDVVPDRPERIIGYRSSFYDVNDDRTVENASYVRSDFKFGGGGLLTSSRTLARFGAIHIKPGFFKLSTLTEDLFIEQARNNGKSVNIGLAWRVGIDQDFGKVYHHSGSLPGGRSVLMVWPDQDFTIAVTSNTTNSPYYAEQFAQVLSHIYFENTTRHNFQESQLDTLTKELIFSSDDNTKYSFAISGKNNSGNMDVPPSVKDELKKREFPIPNTIPVLAVYTNKDGSSSIILASDIGLHRLEIQRLESNKASGFISELSNKYEWEIKKFDFNEAGN